MFSFFASILSISLCPLFSLTFSLPTFLCHSYKDLFLYCTLSCTFFSLFICISHIFIRLSFSLLQLIYFYYFLSIFLSRSLPPLSVWRLYNNFLSPYLSFLSLQFYHFH
jgi:hypothetical protein